MSQNQMQYLHIFAWLRLSVNKNLIKFVGNVFFVENAFVLQIIYCGLSFTKSRDFWILFFLYPNII